MSDDARERLLRSAVTLFRRQGYAATGVKQLLSESGTVAGSLYHHFADGKVGLAVAVVEEQAVMVRNLLSATLAATADTAGALAMWVGALIDSMECSGGLDGCPVAPLAIEAPLAGESLRRAAASAFASWAEVLRTRLEADGLTPQRARATSLVLLSAIQGALLLSRTSGDTAHLRALQTQLPDLLPES